MSQVAEVSTTAAHRVCSVNVSGDLRDVEYGGQIVTIGYFKHPVEGEVVARRLGLSLISHLAPVSIRRLR